MQSDLNRMNLEKETMLLFFCQEGSLSLISLFQKDHRHTYPKADLSKNRELIEYQKASAFFKN